MTKRSRYRWETRVVALCPLNVRVDAVYYWGENPEDVSIDRVPQVALALCDEVQVDDETGEDTDAKRDTGIIKYVDAEFEESAEYFAGDAGESFLGYEYGGVARTWTKAIKDAWERKEKVKPQRPGGGVTSVTRPYLDAVTG